MTFHLSGEFLVLLAVQVALIASAWGAFSSRLKAVEAHGPKVEKIDTLEERIKQFEKHMGDKVDQLSNKVDNLTQLLYNAAMRVPQK